MDRYIVDRIESGFAVCETEGGGVVEITLERLPSSVKEGDCLVYDGAKYALDGDATENRRQTIQEKMRRLFVD